MVLQNLFSDCYDILLMKFRQILDNKSTSNFEDIAFMNSSKRVISCLVNEKLVSSNLIKITKNIDLSEDSFWIVLHSKENSEYKVWVPIIHKITNKNINFDIENGIVHFLHVNDIGKVILTTEIKNQSISCEVLSETKQIFATLLVEQGKECKIPQIINEINNSIKHQILAYKEDTPFVPLWRSPIEYEQSIVEGHATNPMNKLRLLMHQIMVNTEDYNFKDIKVCFYKVKKSMMNIYGNYEKIIQVVAKELNLSYNHETEIIIPVHELQKNVINDYFNNVDLQETVSTSALSECSLRSVNITNISDYTFKLTLVIVISTAMRTVTHHSAYQCHHTEIVLEKIIANKRKLTVLNELGSIIIKNDDDNISQHFSYIIRENVCGILSDSSETAIVSAYLTEKFDNEYNITKLFDLKTQDDKDNFGKLYAELIIDSFFDIVYEYGLTFEAHQQNVLLRVKKNAMGYELVGFIVRDFTGILVHQDTLHSKIGMQVKLLNGNTKNAAKDLEEVYSLNYHTLFYSHLQQIFRSLGMHDSGKGWQLVRHHLKTKKEFLANERCQKFFFSKLAPFKCFMKMKMYNYEHYGELYMDVPNIIHFTGI